MIKRKTPPPGSSYSTEFLLKHLVNHPTSAVMSNQNVPRQVSQFRRGQLEDTVGQGFFEGASHSIPNGAGQTSAAVASSSGLKKNAQVLSSSFNNAGMGGLGGGGGTLKQIPEIYSPLWLSSNLNLPRDRATINAWCRAFFALNPYVHNAINLHSTYPISKLNIKCANKEVEKFFNDMIEETGLMNICVQIAMEYWLLGEAYPYAELDPNRGKWRRFILQNPDYIVVKRTVIADEPVIMLRPDMNLQRIVTSNKPSDVEQRKQLNQYIIDAVRRGENIPLNNFNISQIARKISPYEIRGTGLPVPIFRSLMLFDKMRESKFAQADGMINPLTIVKVGGTGEGMESLHPTAEVLEQYRELFECHDEETEVLTQDGFQKFNEVIQYQEAMDGTFDQSIITNIVPKVGVKIACFNPENEQLEYHEPVGASLYNYDGEMYHFHNEKMDIKVTPNHKMWIQERQYKYGDGKRQCVWGEWKKVEAQELKLTDYNRFRAKVSWTGIEVNNTKIDDKEVPIELYLEYLGYLISEGCLYTNNEFQYTVGISQSVSKFKNEMHTCLERLCSILDKSYSHRIEKRSEYSDNDDVWSGIISGKSIYEHFKNEVQGKNGSTKSYDKQMPSWVKELSPRLLSILLKALVMGDGSVYGRKNHNLNGFAYYTTSKQLADDVYEIVYKCGFVPTMFSKPLPTDNHVVYTIMWSNSGKGEFPLVWKTARNSQTKIKHDTITHEHYQGKVWCFQVPTGLFITRRNGKITIQGNSIQYDKDAKIFTHPGVNVERVGFGQGIYDISPDITQLVKEFYVGLMVPPVLLDGGGDITYQNGGISLDVLRQRYMQFRNMLALWLKRKIFAPISELQGFWEYKQGGSGRSSEKQLIIPEVDWNHMSIFDAGDYIQNLITLTAPLAEGQAPRVSKQTLYRSLGLEWEDEQRKLRKEAIQDAINTKEREALNTQTLTALRTIGEDDEIVLPEADETNKEIPVPGETGAGGAMPDLGGLPGLGGGGEAPPAPTALPSTPPPATPPPAK